MKKALFVALSIIILGFIGYFAVIYYVPYSEGYRSGELIKFSRKGVLVKTWEGQISQGISGTNIFSFSVEDGEPEIIEKMKEYQGRYVKVEYKERYATFFWLGDTKYFITSIQLEASPHFGN